MSILSHYEKTKEYPNQDILIKKLLKNRNFQLVSTNIGTTFIAMIVSSITNDLKNVPVLSPQIISKYFINNSHAQIQFSIPLSVVSIDKQDRYMTVNVGNELKALYGLGEIIIPISKVYADKLKISDYITIDVGYDSSYHITATRYDESFTSYVKHVNDILQNMSSLEDSCKQSDSDGNATWLAIDLGSENFASVIDTVTFKPFVIDLSYIFAHHKVYTSELERLHEKLANNDQHTLERIYAQEKKMKRAIKLVINKTIKYLFEYCKEHQIDTIICGKAGMDFVEEPSYRVSSANLASILQGVFRYGLSLESEMHEINFIEIDEAKTSQYCCKCGTLDKKGRHKKSNLYMCKSCGSVANGDINACINLILRYALESYHCDDKQKQADYIYSSVDFSNLVNIPHVRPIKKIEQ
jgi:transposase